MASPEVVGTAILAVLSSFIQGAKAQYPDYSPVQYRLQHTYEGPSFFDHFNYYSDDDPTDGFVTYTFPLPSKPPIKYRAPKYLTNLLTPGF